MEEVLILIKALLKMTINPNEALGQVLILLTSKDAVKTKRPDPKQVTQCTDQTAGSDLETYRDVIYIISTMYPGI